MATTTTTLSIAEYLETNYRPDREFIDGELKERNLGKRMHSRAQALLTGWFLRHETEWSVMALTEQRVRVAADRVRIPDVLLTTLDDQEETLVHPPVLVIEVLSPEDTYRDVEARAEDYLALGVKGVWIIDPASQNGRMCDGVAWTAARRLTVPGTAIYVDLDELFSLMHRAG